MSSGKVKELYCNKCKKITDHVSVSNRDFVEMTPEQGEGIRKACGALCDVLGFQYVVGKMHRCKKCGAFRTSGGLLGDQYDMG